MITPAEPSAASGEVRLSGEAGGNYRVHVMSWWEIPFRSVVRQQYDFSCGSAAVATLLTHHYERPTEENDSFASMWATGDQKVIQKTGFSMLDMKQYLASVGHRAEGYKLSLEQLKELRRPSIVLLDLKGFKHFVVVKGISSDRVLVGDPMLGLNQYSHNDFAKIWNGIVLAIVSDDSGKFNLASDWGPWSSAPLEQKALHVGAGDLTTHLPPFYQLTPQLLIDARIGTVK